MSVWKRCLFQTSSPDIAPRLSTYHCTTSSAANDTDELGLDLSVNQHLNDIQLSVTESGDEVG